MPPTGRSYQSPLIAEYFEAQRRVDEMNRIAERAMTEQANRAQADLARAEEVAGIAHRLGYGREASSLQSLSAPMRAALRSATDFEAAIARRVLASASPSDLEQARRAVAGAPTDVASALGFVTAIKSLSIRPLLSEQTRPAEVVEGLAAVFSNPDAPSVPVPLETVAEIENQITKLGRDVKIEPDFDLGQLLTERGTRESVGDDLLRQRLLVIAGLILIWQFLLVCWELTGQVSRSPGQASGMETPADYLSRMENAFDVTSVISTLLWLRNKNR